MRAFFATLCLTLSLEHSALAQETLLAVNVPDGDGRPVPGAEAFMLAHVRNTLPMIRPRSNVLSSRSSTPARLSSETLQQVSRTMARLTLRPGRAPLPADIT